MSKAHWLGLSTLPGVGGATLSKLIERFGTAEAVYRASDTELLAIPRITEQTIAHLQQIRLEQLEAEILSLEEAGISVLSWEDADYPHLLQSISSAPPILYVQGQFDPQDEKAVAIIGTREPTPDAIQIAQSIAQECAHRGLTIISGLAIGIDTAVHKGALLAENGRTIAVLGSGLQAIHPRQNIPLAEQITLRGAVISEYRPQTRVKGSQLMARDRIVSGLSLAVIVIQANEKSGTLDTAQKARKQGRLLCAVPGSPGADMLISQGADALDTDYIDYDALVKRILNKPYSSKPQQMSLF
ncbi:MAG: DNA-processing protein DprA [Anaerolineales bacterium]|nr:DNA-processing protein DprA [Anaerolineales bacterium]